MFAKTAKPRSDAALVWEQSECLARPTYPHITITRCADQPRQAQRSPARPSLAQPRQQRGSAQTSPAEKLAGPSAALAGTAARPTQFSQSGQLACPAQPSPAQPSPVQLDPASLTSPASPALPGLPPTAWPSPASQSWAAQPSKPILGSQLGPDWNPACQPGMCIFFFVLGCCAVRELF